MIEDAEDTTPRRIITTSYNHDAGEVEVGIGARPDTLESLLSQLAAVTGLVVA